MRRALAVFTAIMVILGIVAGAGAAGAVTADQEAIDAGPIYADTNNTTETTTTIADENTTTENTTVDDNTTTENTTDLNETEPVNDTDTNETDSLNETNETTETVAPGAQLSAIVSTQQAEIRGSVSERAFGLSVAAAHSNQSKARLVANETEQLERQLAHLRNQTEEFEQAHENGTIPEGAYYAHVSRLEAQITSMERLINQTESTSEAIPEDVRQAHGINTTQLETLRSQARNMSGPETAAVARSVVGPNPGQHMGQGPPAHAGPPEDAPGNGAMGPGDNTTGPAANESMGPSADNRTTGPSADNRTMGPPDENSPGSNSGNGGGPSGQTGPPTDAGNQNPGSGNQGPPQESE
ncbi:hypothetical protein RH831_07795 [Halodesulfurarchaeum sp. HSR-GB]|uniref:hypothetical protein n=1 Tax=Halodesulfurarchaeum sp. HSR-GB TaxID=3074077 RepID=UPI0028623611|nr:hypothetical protein [Halodesulfurarchaeum sp. HSR-GB]MDR5657082.1 hypothetical protein [Halodesulfurarchaeum sp. HSR-GB]